MRATLNSVSVRGGVEKEKRLTYKVVPITQGYDRVCIIVVVERKVRIAWVYDKLSTCIKGRAGRRRTPDDEDST